ncbi:MAG: DUF4214 domain-containing protein [Chloroflexota bacterium]|nr:DUF4214 domain-containing protein [Chloroflexota bacterium]
MSHLNAQIVRLYDTVFDRAPDAGGLEFWNNASHTGFGLRDLATFFISAPEFASTYGEPTNRGFVESMYLNVLDRPGEAEGIAFWTNALDAGLADRPQIVVGFSESAEHVAQMARPQAPPVPQPVPVPAPTGWNVVKDMPGYDDVMTGTSGRDIFMVQDGGIIEGFTQGQDRIGVGHLSETEFLFLGRASGQSVGPNVSWGGSGEVGTGKVYVAPLGNGMEDSPHSFKGTPGTSLLPEFIVRGVDTFTAADFIL